MARNSVCAVVQFRAFARCPRGALVALDVALHLLVRAVRGRADLFSTVSGRATDFANPLCRFDIAGRRLERLVPDFRALGPFEPLHCRTPPVAFSSEVGTGSREENASSKQTM